MHTRRTIQAAVACSAGVLLAAVAATPSAADTYTIVPCSTTALRAALTAANAADGGDLVLAPGCTYTLSDAVADEDGLPQITAPITVAGAGTTIDRVASAPAFRIFDVAAEGDLTLSAVTVSGGSVSSEGGGILNNGTLRLNGAEVKNASAESGGGVANHGDLYVNAGRIAFNTASTSGGGLLNSGTAEIRGSSVDGNTVTGTDGLGGGILNDGGSVEVSLSAVGSNTATASGSSGAGLATVGGSLDVNSSTVENNEAATAPGGIYNDGGAVLLVLAGVFDNAPTNCAGSPSPVVGCFN